MGVLKGFLYACAAAFLLGGLTAGRFLWYVDWPIAAILVAGGGAALAWLTWGQAKKFNAQADLGQRVQFETTVKQLADKNGGSVAFDAILHATGESKESAQGKMRELVGRGICEMDFGPNGELLYKMTPLDEARASLAAMKEKT